MGWTKMGWLTKPSSLSFLSLLAIVHKLFNCESVLFDTFTTLQLQQLMQNLRLNQTQWKPLVVVQMTLRLLVEEDLQLTKRGYWQSLGQPGLEKIAWIRAEANIKSFNISLCWIYILWGHLWPLWSRWRWLVHSWSIIIAAHLCNSGWRLSSY